MKKNSVFLALLLCVSLLAGCGGGQTAAPPTAEPTPEPAAAPGTVSDGVYTNESLGLSFVFPEGWVLASEEEARTILNADPNDQSTVYDMLVGDTVYGMMVYVIYMDLTRTIGGTSSTAESMVRESADAINTVEGFHADVDSIFTATLCGEEYAAVNITNDGNSLYQRLFCRRLGNSGVMVGATAASAESMENLVGFFTDDPAAVPDSILPPEPVVEAPASAFSRGVISDGVYTSDYLGIVFTPPEEGWVYASDEELAELMDVSMELIGDQLTDNELMIEMSKLSTIYDMAVSGPDSLPVVQVGLENLALTIGGTSITEEEYAAIVATNLASVTTATYEVGEVYTVDMAGRTFTALTATIPDYDIYQNFYMLRFEKYMLFISTTYTGEYPAEKLEACFSGLDA